MKQTDDTVHSFEINYASVLVAAMVAMAFSAFWYNEAFWGAALLKARGVSPDDTTNMGAKLVVEFAELCLSSVAVAFLVTRLGYTTLVKALELSAVLGVGIVGANIASGIHWSVGIEPGLTAIEVGHAYLTVLIFSLFSCLWRKHTPS